MLYEYCILIKINLKLFKPLLSGQLSIWWFDREILRKMRIVYIKISWTNFQS